MVENFVPTVYAGSVFKDFLVLNQSVISVLRFYCFYMTSQWIQPALRAVNNKTAGIMEQQVL